MLEGRALLESAVARVDAVRCRAPAHGWSPEEPVTRTAVVLVRRGVFRRRVDGRAMLADVTTGYLQRPGECQQMAHPAGGDVCTTIGIPDDLADRLASADLPVADRLFADRPAAAGSVPAGRVAVLPAADLAHRRLLTASPADRPDLAADLITALLPAAVSPTGWSRPDHSAIDHVRALLHTDPARDLTALAASAGCSPWHLSRMFHRTAGITLSAYRRRLRVRAALDELTASAGADLATVAVRTGFADQSHMTRAIRAETGLPPGALRRRLGWAEPGSSGRVRHPEAPPGR